MLSFNPNRGFNEMTDETTDLANIDNNLINPEVEEIVHNVATIKGSTKKQRFHMYRMFNLPIKTCAKLAGYSDEYGYQLVREYKYNPKVRHSVEQILSDMPEAYRSVCRIRLPQIANIEGKALQEYENDPKLAIDKPQLLKQVKQAGGVDLNEHVQPPKAPTINIKEFLLFHESLMPKLPTKDVEEGEIIDTK
jgi:hypothetical protein